MMLMPYDWQELAALIAVLATIWGVMAIFLHAFMARYFAPRASMIRAEARISQLETAITGLPTHADVAMLNARITEMAALVAGLGATLAAVKHTVDLLLEHQLQERE